MGQCFPPPFPVFEPINFWRILKFEPLIYLLLIQLCVWSSDGWEKQKTRFLQLPSGRPPSSQSDTRVQFHQDQVHFLVVHETQIAIYETTKLECVKQVFFLPPFLFVHLFFVLEAMPYPCPSFVNSHFSGRHGNLVHQSLMQHSLATVKWYMPAFWMQLSVCLPLLVSDYVVELVLQLIFLLVWGISLTPLWSLCNAPALRAIHKLMKFWCNEPLEWAYNDLIGWFILLPILLCWILVRKGWCFFSFSFEKT